MRAFELADEEQQQELRFMLSIVDSESKIAKAKQLFIDLGVLEDAKNIKLKYQEKAILSLESINVEEGHKNVLTALAEQLLNREI